MKYKIEIVETLSREVEVEADSFESALEDVERRYRKGEFILYAEDYKDTDFKRAETEK